MGALVDAFHGADLISRSTPFDPEWKAVPDDTNPVEELVRYRVTFDGPEGDKRQVAWQFDTAAGDPEGSDLQLFATLSSYMDLIEQTGTPIAG
jgi:hypothetical protein